MNKILLTLPFLYACSLPVGGALIAPATDAGPDAPPVVDGATAPDAGPAWVPDPPAAVTCIVPLGGGESVGYDIVCGAHGNEPTVFYGDWACGNLPLPLPQEPCASGMFCIVYVPDGGALSGACP